MQTPAPGSVSTAPDPVRQQLDELDAFLQRMLGLPVQPSSAAETPGARSFPPAVVLSEEAGRSSPDDFRVPDTALPVAGVITADPVLPEALRDPGVEMERFPFERRTTYATRLVTANWLWPLVGINKAYDVPTYLLGPAGRWLRESGRSTVGWLGLGLIALAAAWVAFDWLSWKW